MIKITINWKKIEDWCMDYTNHVSGRPFGGRYVPSIDLARIEAHIGPGTSILWGYGDPGYLPALHSIRMPMPRQVVLQDALYCLAHEYGHARQDTEQRLIRRRLAARWGIKITPRVLWEELEASLIGWKLLLDEDLFHPRMIVYGVRSWSTYLIGYVGQWARQRRGADRMEKEIFTYVGIGGSES